MIADWSQLQALVTRLSAAPVRVGPATAAAIAKGVLEGRNTARDVFRSQVRQVYLPHYAASITAEMTGPFSGEFGPDPSLPQGGMGRGVEFGSSNAGPIAHMGPAADQLENSLPDDLLDIVVESTL